MDIHLQAKCIPVVDHCSYIPCNYRGIRNRAMAYRSMAYLQAQNRLILCLTNCGVIGHFRLSRDRGRSVALNNPLKRTEMRANNLITHSISIEGIAWIVSYVGFWETSTGRRTLPNGPRLKSWRTSNKPYASQTVASRTYIHVGVLRSSGLSPW